LTEPSGFEVQPDAGEEAADVSGVGLRRPYGIDKSAPASVAPALISSPPEEVRRYG